MRIIILLLIFTTVAMSVGCGKTEIVLSSQDGNKYLKYDCHNIKSQIRTMDDIYILMNNFSPVINNMRDKGDTVGLISLNSSIQQQDYYKVEAIVVNNLCVINKQNKKWYNFTF